MDALILGLRVVVALGAVLGLMWLLQRRLGKGTGRRRADRALTIVSRQSVGQKASVVVVDAAGQRFLLGVTEHAVNVLHTGDIPAEPEEVAVPGTRRGAGDFARILAAAGSPARLQPAGSPAVRGASRRRQRRCPCPVARRRGTPRCPAAAPFTGTPMPAAAPPRQRVGAPATRRCTARSLPAPPGSRPPPLSGADAAIDPPARLQRHPLATCRRQTAQAPGPGPRRRAACRPPAVAERLGRPRRTHRPRPAGAADRPGQSRRRQRQHRDQRDGRQTVHRGPDPDRHHAAAPLRRRCC